MVYTCKMCGQTTLRAYTSEDGKMVDICAACKAKYDHQPKNEQTKEEKELIELDKVNARIDKMATVFKFNENRFCEIESKNGKLEKRVEILEKKAEDLANWLSNVDNKINNKHGGNNGRK